MRILFVHPNYHSGGAEIAGTWSPAWVAYLAGSLRRAGFDDVHFIDAMTNHMEDGELAQRLAALNPDVVCDKAITPSIYKAERALEVAKEVNPDVVTVLGGVHVGGVRVGGVRVRRVAVVFSHDQVLAGTVVLETDVGHSVLPPVMVGDVDQVGSGFISQCSGERQSADVISSLIAGISCASRR